MVKLSDPFSGYLLAYGNFLLHIAYFVAILNVPKNETCEGFDYELSWKLLLASHIIVFILQLISYKFKDTEHLIVPHALEWVSILFYQGSLFYT